jgi:hypothetical protein
VSYEVLAFPELGRDLFTQLKSLKNASVIGVQCGKHGIDLGRTRWKNIRAEGHGRLAKSRNGGLAQSHKGAQKMVDLRLAYRRQ